MVKRSTWIFLVIFLVLIAAGIYLQKNENALQVGPTDTPAPVPTTDYLFSTQEEGVVTSLFIQDKDGKSLELKRVDGQWKITQPFEAAAIQSSAEEAASQVTALPITDSLTLDDSVVGLTAPAYTITVGFSSGKTVTAKVGDETPIGSGYYVRKEGGPVLVVSKSGILALVGMLDTPPFVETPTPSPTAIPPTETPTSTATPASETPNGSVMPTATKMP